MREDVKNEGGGVRQEIEKLFWLVECHTTWFESKFKIGFITRIVPYLDSILALYFVVTTIGILIILCTRLLSENYFLTVSDFIMVDSQTYVCNSFSIFRPWNEESSNHFAFEAYIYII